MTPRAEGPLPPASRAALAALYLRLADALESAAELAEHHAQRLRDKGNEQDAAIELERATRARMAAKRGRALGLRLTSSNPDHGNDPSQSGPSGSEPEARFRV